MSEFIPKDAHEEQWQKIKEENLLKKQKMGDIYEVRAKACQRLIDRFC